MEGSHLRNMSLFPLMSAAGHEAMLRNPQFVTEDKEPNVATSIDFLRVFAKKFPAVGAEFISTAGLTWEQILECSDQYVEFEEPLPERLIPDKVREHLSEEQIKVQMERRPPFTAPCSAAFKAASKEAREASQNASVGRVIQLLISSECNARSMLLELAPADTLDLAIAKIDTAPSEASSPETMITSFKDNVRSLLDKTWPDLRQIGETERSREFRDKHFAENPGYYSGRVDLGTELQKPSPSEAQSFSLRCGTCLHAAENEARMRNAPERTLDHMFFSLLQEDLDTTKFLQSKGIDWREWRDQIDQEIPTYEGEGPKFPPSSRDLGMNLPSHELMPPMDMKADLDRMKGKDDFAERMKERRAKARPRKFSDLLWLIPCLKEKDTLAYGYLTTAGITIEEIEAMTDCKY